MFKNDIFREISKHKKILEKHQNLLLLFSAAFELTPGFSDVSILQKEFLITEIVFSYQHFGYSLFASSSMELAKQGLAKFCGVPPEFIEKYLLHLKEFLQDEIDFEKKEIYFTAGALENSFSREFIKRVFCTEKEEDIFTGMFVFDEIYVENIRDISRKKISEYNFQNESILDSSLIKKEQESIYFEYIYNEFNLFFQNLKKEPLTLMVGRLESFINFSKSDMETLFIFRKNNGFFDERSRKITAILSLLVPHKNSSGQMLCKDTLLTVSQITKLFSSKFKSDYFNLNPIRTLLGLANEDELKKHIEFLIEESINCGVIFKIPQGSKNFSYGLSENGLKIIQPFQSVLTDSILFSTN